MKFPRIHRYILNNLLAIDKLANTLIGGDSDETLSARASRLSQSHRMTWGLLAIMLNRLQQHHTSGAMLHDQQRAEYIVAVEEWARGVNG